MIRERKIKKREEFGGNRAGMQKAARVTRSCRRRLQGGVKQPSKAAGPVPAGGDP